MDIALLHTTTGIQQVDDFLRGFIGLCELVFPARVRSCYLGGSYSDGTAVGDDRSPSSSDIDLFVIFLGIVQEAEEDSFQHLLVACRCINPLALDAHVYSEDDLLGEPRLEATQTSFLSVLINHSSLFIYGNDLRPSLPDVPFSRYVLDVIESGLFHLGIPRQRNDIAYPLTTPLVYPLAYPQPDGEFYGYDIVSARPDAARGTRVFVAITTWIATFILALSTGRYAAQKSQSIKLCKQYLPDDARIQLVVTIYEHCKTAWRYALPNHAEDRELLRSLCRETLALENEYLQLCRDYILARLQQGGAQEQRQIVRILQNVTYYEHDTGSVSEL